MRQMNARRDVETAPPYICSLSGDARQFYSPLTTTAFLWFQAANDRHNMWNGGTSIIVAAPGYYEINARFRMDPPGTYTVKMDLRRIRSGVDVSLSTRTFYAHAVSALWAGIVISTDYLMLDDEIYVTLYHENGAGVDADTSGGSKLELVPA